MNIKQTLCTTPTTICPELGLTHKPLHKHRSNAFRKANFINIFKKPSIQTAKVNCVFEETRAGPESALLVSPRLLSLFIK